MFPALSVANPKGPAKRAALPTPLTLQQRPPARVLGFEGNPANVVTTPAGVIFRIVALTQSATYTFPPRSVPIPAGLLNRAAEPVPSALPVLKKPGVPARVVTAPDGVILRIVLLNISLT